MTSLGYVATATAILLIVIVTYLQGLIRSAPQCFTVP